MPMNTMKAHWPAWLQHCILQANVANYQHICDGDEQSPVEIDKLTEAGSSFGCNSLH